MGLSKKGFCSPLSLISEKKPVQSVASFLIPRASVAYSLPSWHMPDSSHKQAIRNSQQRGQDFPPTISASRQKLCNADTLLPLQDCRKACLPGMGMPCEKHARLRQIASVCILPDILFSAVYPSSRSCLYKWLCIRMDLHFGTRQQGGLSRVQWLRPSVKSSASRCQRQGAAERAGPPLMSLLPPPLPPPPRPFLSPLPFPSSQEGAEEEAWKRWRMLCPLHFLHSMAWDRWGCRSSRSDGIRWAHVHQRHICAQ